MSRHELGVEVLGPWSLATSKTFWEGFAPAALEPHVEIQQLRTVFCVEADWRRAEVALTQVDETARMVVTGPGNLQAAGEQACRFLSLDVDARGWPDIAKRDPVIADAQEQLPGLRPCGFHSPYEAAAWSVLSQRIRIVQAARLRDELVRRHGNDGAFPVPEALRVLDLDLPGRKAEYLRAVAEAALEGRLDGAFLRSVDPDEAVRAVQVIRASDPSPPSSSSFAGRTHPMRFLDANGGWRPRSPSATAPTARSPKCRRPGGPSVPGPPCTCAPCASSVLGSSADAAPPRQVVLDVLVERSAYETAARNLRPLADASVAVRHRDP